MKSCIYKDLKELQTYVQTFHGVQLKRGQNKNKYINKAKKKRYKTDLTAACWYLADGETPGAIAHSQRPSLCLASP